MRFRLFVAALLALPICVAAHADSFSSSVLTSDEGRFILGINANGDVLIDVASTTDIYQIYSDGHLASSSSVLPSFVSDSGVACAAPAGVSTGPAVCNGDREVYMTGTSHSASFYEIYPGSAPLGDFLFNGFGMVDPIVSSSGVIFAALNSNGDFVYIDQRNENIIEALDVVATPEPSSFMLLGTGLLGMVGVMKRRYA